MDDILHILDILRERAQADLVVLTKQRAAFLAQILEIKQAAGYAREKLPDVTDQHVWERWNYSQIIRIKNLEKKITALDVDIVKAKAHFKTILAKHLAAQDMAALAEREVQTQRAENEADEQLEVFRQNTVYRS